MMVPDKHVLEIALGVGDTFTKRSPLMDDVLLQASRHVVGIAKVKGSVQVHVVENRQESRLFRIAVFLVP